MKPYRARKLLSTIITQDKPGWNKNEQQYRSLPLLPGNGQELCVKDPCIRPLW